MLKEYFLNKIKEKYPDNFSKYDYSLLPDKVVYNDKVNFSCNTHGIFTQLIDNHLQGKGCNQCAIQNRANKRRLTKEEIISRANQLHNFKFLYNLDRYKGRNTDKIIITCPVHSSFYQTVAGHLNGNGCPKCKFDKLSILYSSNVEEFIRKARLIHGDKYDYSKVVYVNAFTKVIIICPIHGEFTQTPSDHLQGQGCYLCGINKRANLIKYTKTEFVQRAINVHGIFYNYDKFIYNDCHSKGIITCPIHGDFLQTANNHLRGNGCPVCKESYGEKNISRILEKYNIVYIKQQKILPYNYKYDFYLPEYDIYIEYHGRQHYDVDEFFGGKDKFDKTQRRDKTKIELVRHSTGSLIVIKHTFKTKEQIENELIRLFNYIHPQFFKDKEITKQAIIDSNIYLIQDGISYKRK